MAEDPSENENAKFREGFLRAFAVYGGVGLQLAVSVGGGLIGGKILDDKLGTSPLFLIVGIALGTVAGFYNLVTVLNREQKRKSSDESR